MTDYIIGYKNWQKEYLSHPDNKRLIWIYIKLNNNIEIYLKQYEEWLSFNKYCKQNKVHIVEVGLRYRSNIIITNALDAEAVYVVRSVKGEFGGITKQCYTIGLLKEGVVHKTMWLTPELIEESSYEDELENCFSEALIYNDEKTKAKII